MPCVERLEEYGTEAIVGETLAANRFAAEIRFPDIFATCPKAQTVFELYTRRKLRTSDEVADCLTLIIETQALLYVGNSFDVISLEPVIGIDIIGMLANKCANDMNRINTISARNAGDLRSQLGVGFQQVVYFLIFRFVCSVQLARSLGGGGWNTRLGRVAVAFGNNGHSLVPVAK